VATPSDLPLALPTALIKLDPRSLLVAIRVIISVPIPIRGTIVVARVGGTVRLQVLDVPSTLEEVFVVYQLVDVFPYSSRDFVWAREPFGQLSAEMFRPIRCRVRLLPYIISDVELDLTTFRVAVAFGTSLDLAQQPLN
jgi:hypothetical protein